MKKYLLPSGLILALGLGIALAQNINKSIQLSQDATGTIGYDTSNNVYFPAHILTTGLAGAPTVSSPLGTAPTVTGTDFMGTITGGSAANTTATITFKTAFLATPDCILQTRNPGVSTLAYNTATTGINITTATMGAAVATWVCSGAK